MPANVGREFLIKTSAGAVIASGIQNKSTSFANARVDITSDDDSGYATALEIPGEKSLSITFDGITKDASLRAAVMSSTNVMLTGVDIEYIDGATLTGDFFLDSLEYNGAYNDAVKFSASMSSSGEFTETPASGGGGSGGEG